MSTEQNKAAARRVYDECFSKGSIVAVDELFDPNYVDHTQALPNQAPGREGVKQLLSVYRTTFPDLHVTVENMIAEGDMVAVHWTGRGTDKGGFMGRPPTGKQTVIPGIEMLRYENGKVVERWGLVDSMALMAQLGVIPAPGH